MYKVSVTCNPYKNISGEVGNDRFFPAKGEDDYNESGLFNSHQILDGYPGDTLGKIADIGCGNLRIGRFLSTFCSIYIGVDISQAVLEAARVKAGEYGLDNVSLVLLDDFKEENTCDLVICFQVLQHNTYEDQINIIHVIRKALKPGGWACIHLPKIENKPTYVNYNTCMCFTKEQALELGSYFSACVLEEQTLLEGWDDYYLWVQK